MVGSLFNKYKVFSCKIDMNLAYKETFSLSFLLQIDDTMQFEQMFRINITG